MIDPKTWNCVSDYFRCPEQLLRFSLRRSLRLRDGYFRFGTDVICYGSYAGRRPATHPFGKLPDALEDVEITDGFAQLPFDPSQVADNLRREVYVRDWRDGASASKLAQLYYALRPLLPLWVRKQLQKAYVGNWHDLAFPKWPVDCTVDKLMTELLIFSMRTTGNDRIPFIWFWPKNAVSCAIVTHDVENKSASDFCEQLLDIDDSFGVKASFQLMPECRSAVRRELLQSIQNRGFEIALHDLDHDGHVYENHARFVDRAAEINFNANKYGAEGFRAGYLYRKQLWYDALKVSYDMSIPNVAHLDPQRGGCCTVMPYFLGDVLELPVTTTHDYTLFHILDDDSIDLWKKQIEIILGNYGLISFIVHPEQLIDKRQRCMYEALLAYLSCLQDETGIWMTTPGEVNRWWRQRSEMRLVQNTNGWQIEGIGSERASIAYAVLQDNRLSYEFDTVAIGDSACR